MKCEVEQLTRQAPSFQTQPRQHMDAAMMKAIGIDVVDRIFTPRQQACSQLKCCLFRVLCFVFDLENPDVIE
jgi:hypothetical protein